MYHRHKILQIYLNGNKYLTNLNEIINYNQWPNIALAMLCIVAYQVKHNLLQIQRLLPF